MRPHLTVPGPYLLVLPRLLTASLASLHKQVYQSVGRVDPNAVSNVKKYVHYHISTKCIDPSLF